MITVAGAVASLSSIIRIDARNGSNFEPADRRSYRGGSDNERSRSTVFRDIPNDPAIFVFDQPSRSSKR